MLCCKNKYSESRKIRVQSENRANSSYIFKKLLHGMDLSDCESRLGKPESIGQAARRSG